VDPRERVHGVVVRAALDRAVAERQPQVVLEVVAERDRGVDRAPLGRPRALDVEDGGPALVDRVLAGEVDERDEAEVRVAGGRAALLDLDLGVACEERDARAPVPAGGS